MHFLIVISYLFINEKGLNRFTIDDQFLQPTKGITSGACPNNVRLGLFSIQSECYDSSDSVPIVIASDRFCFQD